MTALVTGSLAYDYLIRIDGKFSDRWPLSPDGAFAAAYIAPSLSRAVGGCAGNICYALNGLGEQPAMMATVGSDFAPYIDYLHDLGISTEHLATLPDHYTAQAYMVTDGDNNQFIVFHPGATAEAHRQRIVKLLPTLSPPPQLAIVSPNGKEGMLQHCRDLAEAQVPFLFDPGQAIGMFSGEELSECLTLAPYAIFNHGEFEVLQNATGLDLAAAAAMLQALIVTNGVQGSTAYSNGETHTTECVHFGETQDPTGCGDAYRAGLIYGMIRNWDWQPLLQFASVIAAIKATHGAAQGYTLTLESASVAYQQATGTPLPQ